MFRKLLIIIDIVLILATAGCARNSEARKRHYIDRGSSYLQQGKYQEAIIEYENAVQIDPRNSDAHYGLAQCLIKEGDWTHAYQELMSAVEFAPNNWKAQLTLGNLLLAGHHVAEARDRAQTVLRADPGNAQAEVLLAASDAAAGDLNKGISEGQQAVQMNPSRSDSYLFLAEAEEKNKDFLSAERDYRKASSLNPKSAPLMLRLGEFLARQKRYSDAEQEFKLASTSAPTDPAPRAALAQLYFTQGQKEMAEKVLRDASTSLKDNPRAYRMLADYYLSQKQMDKALTEFASLHSEHPKDITVTKTYIGILIDQNRLDDASKLTDEILQSSSSDTDALIFRGEILIRQGKASDAIPILASAAKNAPNNPIAHYQLGVAHAETSDDAEAQSEWEKAATLAPNMVDSERALALLAVRKSDASLLTSSSEQLMRIEPHAAEGYIWNAKAFLLKGNENDAIEDLKKAMEAAPQDSAPLARMADLRFAHKQYDDAAKLYSQALALNPNAVDALVGLVNIDLVRKQPAEALKRVQEQIARIPDNTNLYVLLGQAELRNQDSAKAEQAFQKAIDLNKNNVNAFLMLASTEVARGSVDQAITNYQQALQTNPRDVRLHAGLGMLLEMRGDWQKAEDSYQRALDIQPDYPLAANNLAYLMLEHGGNVNVALSLAQTARRGLPDQPNAADTLGWAYYHQGAYSSAIDMLQQAVSENSKNATFHYHLGMAYEKASKYAMAKKELEDALQINPNYAQADEIRKVLASKPASN